MVKGIINAIGNLIGNTVPFEVLAKALKRFCRSFNCVLNRNKGKLNDISPTDIVEHFGQAGAKRIPLNAPDSPVKHGKEPFRSI